MKPHSPRSDRSPTPYKPPELSPVTQILLSQLKPYPNNPRKRNRAQKRKLMKGIGRFGFTQPIVTDEDFVILIGHGRYEAALEMGLETVPVIIVRGLSEAEKKALRISDNRIAEESSWDGERLRVEVIEIIDSGFDVLETSFDTIEIDPILQIQSDVADNEPDEVLPDPPGNTVTRTGDLWKLGDSYVLCGDALDDDCYIIALSDELAVAVFTDPPFNRRKGDISGSGKHSDFAMASGEMSDQQFIAFLTAVLILLRDHSVDGAIHHVCMDWRSIAELISVGKAIFARLMNIAIWAKPNAGMGSYLRSQYEMVAIFKKGDAPHINNVQLGRMGRYRSNLWQYATGASFSRQRQQDLADHPTIKPLQMVADAICDVTIVGDLVLDPFGGSGTTLLAAHSVGRRAALIEIDPVYVDVTLRRFEDRFGIEAVLMPDGIPLSDVRKQRDGQSDASANADAVPETKSANANDGWTSTFSAKSSDGEDAA